jgi:hypothetical protein
LAAANSYLGHFKHAQTRRCVRKLWEDFSFLHRFFELSSHRLVRIDQPLRHKSTLHQQVRWLQARFKNHLCLIQIGLYYEAFNAGAQKLAQTVGLKMQNKWRGFSFGCGFPRRFLPRILAELKKQRVPVVVVRETGRELYKAKERLPYLILEYPEG